MPGLPDNQQDRPPLKRRFLSPPTLVSFAIAGAFLLFLVSRFDIDLSATWDSFRAADPLLFVAALAVHYTTFLFRGMRWCILLRNARQDTEVREMSPLHCSSLVLIGWFTNSVTWFRLGDAHRAHAYADYTGGSFSRSMGTVLAERFLDTVVVFLALAASTLALAVNGTGPSWVFVALAAVMLSGLVAVLLLMGVFRDRMARFLPGPLEEAYHRFHEGTVRSFRSGLVLVSALGLLGWMAEVARLFLVSEALGFSLDLPLLVFITLASAMLTLVPFTPGGLGAVEWGVTGLLTLSAKVTTETAALSIVALDRSISWLSIIAVGAAVFLGRELLVRRRGVPTTRDVVPEEG